MYLSGVEPVAAILLRHKSAHGRLDDGLIQSLAHVGRLGEQSDALGSTFVLVGGVLSNLTIVTCDQCLLLMTYSVHTLTVIFRAKTTRLDRKSVV